MNSNYIMAVKSVGKNGLFQSDIIPKSKILYSDDSVLILGETGNVVSVFEDEEHFIVATGIVYGESTSQAIGNDAYYIKQYFDKNGFQPYGHYFYIQYCKSSQELLSFGDYRGGRKVFYFENDKIRGLSSKLKCIVDLGFCEKERNRRYEDFALVYGYFPGNQTLYENVSRSLKGEVVRLNSHLEVAELAPRTLVEKYKISSESEVKEKLYEKLISVTEACLSQTNETGVLLGGFDSALMAALAKKVGKNVKGYTFWYDTGGHNQKNINSVTDSLSIDHEWVKIDSKVIADGLINYSEVFDRPTNWPNYVIQTNYLVEKISLDGFKTCLTGDGCDEAFLGYPGIYRGAKFFSKDYDSMRSLLLMLRSSSEIEFLERKLGHVYRLARRILNNLTMEKKVRLYFMFRIMDETTIRSLFGKDIVKTRNSIKNVLTEYASEIDKLSDTIIAYEGRENIIPNRLKITGAMDACDVKIYSPFMHPEIRDYVRSIPEELLRPSKEAKRDSLGKKILLDMAVEKGLLPYEVVFQPKHAAVDGPLDAWYDKEIRSTVTNLISSVGKIKSQKFLDDLITEKLVEKLYKKKMSVDSITGHAVSLLSTYGSYWR